MKPSPPFSRVGVDFAGLLFVKAKNGQMRKVYMTLFSSCATRAVDLEAMSQIVYSQKRNTSINGVRQCKNLQGCRKGTMQTFQGSTGERWNVKPLNWAVFQSRKGPIVGRIFWTNDRECQKMSSKGTGKCPTDIWRLPTVLLEVKAKLNLWLLTYDYSNPIKEEVFTPAHLVHGRRITTLPKLQDDDEEEVGIMRGAGIWVNSSFWRWWLRE